MSMASLLRYSWLLLLNWLACRGSFGIGAYKCRLCRGCLDGGLLLLSLGSLLTLSLDLVIAAHPAFQRTIDFSRRRDRHVKIKIIKRRGVLGNIDDILGLIH